MRAALPPPFARTQQLTLVPSRGGRQWGGMKDSGIGRENGLEAFRAYSQSKSIVINTAPEETSRVQDDWFSEAKQDVRYG